MSTRSAAINSTPLRLPTFQSLFWLTGVVGVLVIADVVLWWFGQESWRAPLGWNLALLAALLGGARFIYHSTVELLDWRFGTDLALSLALVAALLLGETWVAAEVVLIALIGESLEAITFRRSQRELRQLLTLQPASVRIRRGDATLDIPLSAVVVGDVAVIRPGERIPVDGILVSGRGPVDESSLTGEAIPAEKEVGAEVFAGTLNQFGSLDVQVTRVGQQSVLGQMLRIVAEARQNKATVERLVDRLAMVFLPAVLLLASGTFLATNFDRLRVSFTGDSTTGLPWEWMPTLAVLVVACPCALVLATPAAMMASLAWLARRGVVVTGGAALEQLATVTQIAFDKTGTLTQGKLHVVECIPLAGHESAELLRVAAAAEQSSEHLLAQAILHAAAERQLALPQVLDFMALPGAGVQARIGIPHEPEKSKSVLVGSPRFIREHAISIPQEADEALQRLDQQGLSALLVSVDGQAIGLIGVGDTLRPEAAAVLTELRATGIQEFALLSGDRNASVRGVAQSLGIERFAAELSPNEKANWLADWSGKLRRVAMIGDGINDAPALATADVGIALRGVGSEIAAEAADVILLGEPLRPLPGLLRMARHTVRIIYQNVILFAFAANLLGIVLTAWIMPAWSEAWQARSPVAAALFHQAGSVLVLLNSMRLLWIERWEQSWFGRWESWLCDQIALWWKGLLPWRSRGMMVWRYRRIILRLAGCLILLAYLSQILVFVQPDEVAVVRRCGRVHAVLPPGPHLRLPPPFDEITREKPNRIRTLEIGPRRATATADAVEWSSTHATASPSSNGEDDSLLMTGDQSLVELAATIQYRIRDVRLFRFGVREPERVLRAVAEATLRENVATRPLLASASAEPVKVAWDSVPRLGIESQATRPVGFFLGEPAYSGPVDEELLTRGRTTLETQVESQLQAQADALRLGIEILRGGICLQDVHPPLAVVAAFRDVSSAYKEMEQMRNEADAYRRDRLILTGGEAVWRELPADGRELNDEVWKRLHDHLSGQAAVELHAAQAFSADREQSATGEAAGFALRQSAHATAPRLTEWRLFMDAWGDSLAGKRKLVLDRSAAGRRHVLLGLPQDLPTPVLPLAEPSRPPNDE